MPAWARASTSLMSVAFLAFTSSSSVRRSLMGSRRFFTHFLRAKGFICPQNPSLSVFAEEAEGEGCCTEGGVLWGAPVDCAVCATAGTAIAEASRMTANWPGMYRETWLRFFILLGLLVCH